MAEKIVLDSGGNNPGAALFDAAAIDALMTDSITIAKVQPVAMALVISDGNGGWMIDGFVSVDKKMPVQDSDVLNILSDVLDAASGTNQAVGSLNPAIQQLQYNPTRALLTNARVELTDTTSQVFIPADPLLAARDIVTMIAANNDTNPATVDLSLDGNVVNTITIPPGGSVLVTGPFLGITGLDGFDQIGMAWMATLRATPASGSVALTATARTFFG